MDKQEIENWKQLKNLLIAVVAIITLVLGGSMVGESLDITGEQGSFFGGMIFIAVAVFLIWLAIKVNKKDPPTTT